MLRRTQTPVKHSTPLHSTAGRVDFSLCGDPGWNVAMTDEWSDQQWEASDEAIREGAHEILADGPMAMDECHGRPC